MRQMGGGSSCVYTRNDKIEPGDFVQVIDNSSGRVIIQGEVIGLKLFSKPGKKLGNRERLFSIDDKHFFKLDDAAYTVKRLNAHYVNEDFIYSNYKLAPWRRYNHVKRDEVNLFRENSIDELDAEVVNVVRVLNNFSPYMSTVGSCSGHGKHIAWVTIRFEDMLTINDFLNVFVPYSSMLDVTTDACVGTIFHHFSGNVFPGDVEMRLKTKEVGEPGWQALDEFAEYLERIIDIRNRSNNLLHKTIKLEKDRAALSQNP